MKPKEYLLEVYDDTADEWYVAAAFPTMRRAKDAIKKCEGSVIKARIAEDKYV